MGRALVALLWVAASLFLVLPRPAQGSPPGDASPVPPAEEGKPLGFAGLGAHRPDDAPRDFLPIPDRWRIGFPSWRRYDDSSGETPYEEGSVLDPYAQNVLKGDYPIIGNSVFLEVTLVSDSLVEVRSFPVPSGVSTKRPRKEEFFGQFDQLVYAQNFITSFELFKGDTAFKPKDLALKVTPVYNFTYVDLDELGLLNIDVRKGNDRFDYHLAMQELFGEVHLLDLSPNYDFLTAIGGIQGFTSDFRGFLYSDNNLGVRLQANYGANRYQANLAFFSQLEKDTNSGLNRFDSRNQFIFIANFYMQDFIFEGYTFQLSYHYNADQSGKHFDTNGFLTRPAKVGSAAGALSELREKDLNVHYLGWAGDGHIGRLNLSHQYYLAVGKDDFNEIAGKEQDILAHFAAAELSVDLDWLRLKASFLYASGDRNPKNDVAGGFDSILDNPFFAGSGFSYWNRQNIPFTQTALQLVNRLSLLPDLRSSKIEGQSNFVNPGLFLYNVGASARLTPKLFLDANVNFLRFAETEVLQHLLVQSKIDRGIGVDYGIGAQYRPLLTENVIITLSGSALQPWSGYEDIYNHRTIYSAFLSLTLTY